MTRDNFSQKIKETLAKRVGFRCSNPKCHKLTSGPQKEPSKSINIGVAAHIFAAAPNGPRYNCHQTSDDRSSIENGIWLCQNCAKLIDSDELRYTADIIIEWKKLAEEKALKDIQDSSLKDSKTSDSSALPRLIFYRINDGHELVQLLRGTYALEYQYDDFMTEEDRIEISILFSKLIDLNDFIGDMNPLELTQTGFDLDDDIIALAQRGYQLYGHKTDRAFSIKNFDMPTAMLKVLKDKI